jgi:spore coat protein H
VTALIVGAVLAACGGSEPAGTVELFDARTMHEVEMEIDDDALDLLDPPSDNRVPVRLTVDGDVVPVAGVRLKRGASQFEGLEGKPGFSIRIDEFADGRDVDGVTRFTLGNARWDASFVAEPLAYEVFRAAGVPVARTALARVVLNGETFGLYVMRETYDEAWLERTFDEPGGNLYESPGTSDATDTDLELRTNERRNDTSDLATVAEVVAGTPSANAREAIDELVDVDELLTVWAVEAMTGHWDGYAYDITAPGRVPPPVRPPGNPYVNNFYAYDDPADDRFVIIPHGADLTFGLGGREWVVDPGTPAVAPPKQNATIASRLWEDPSFRRELAARIGWTLDEVWDVDALERYADGLADLIRADGLTGTREHVTINEFEEALAARVDFLTQRGPAVRAELEDRS